MRILHTSDWHLGQNFYSKSRAAEHQAFLDWLLETAQSHQVDAIIVAGDIFDTGSPPSYARELYNRFVVNLQQTGCHLVVLAGNHDSVATLNESAIYWRFSTPRSLPAPAMRRRYCRNVTAHRGNSVPGSFFTSTRHYYQPGRANRARKTATFAVSHHRLLPAAVSGCLHAAW